MEWKSWLSLPLTQRAQLPTQPGVYMIVDAEEQVWYVGRSVNLNARWQGRQHHRYKQLSRTDNQRLYRIYWHTFPTDQLSEKEQLYIELCKPHLNYSRVKKYVRKAIQPNEEIGRLLKVLSKRTLLFPGIRSVVLGYYTEVSETEAASLEEYICIVIAVTVNDHDGPILNSYNKSFGRKGNSLKGCWQTYESDCGDANSAIQPVLIPVFISDNIVYEFICYSNLIDKLERLRSSLCDVELVKQNVSALKDLNILSSLVINDKNFTLRSEDYLRHRVPDLRPISELTPILQITN